MAPAVGLSEAAVRQRVQRLIDAGVMQIVAVTDPRVLGFSRQAMIGLKVEGDTRRVAEAVAELHEVEYVVLTAGAFDMLIEVVVEDDEHLLESAQREDPQDRRGADDRDLHLPTDPQGDLPVGYGSDGTAPATPEYQAVTAPSRGSGRRTVGRSGTRPGPPMAGAVCVVVAPPRRWPSGEPVGP